MGQPLHEIREQFSKIHVRSANFTLYGDMSARLMSIIEEHSPAFECYSIDEGFSYLGDMPEVETWARGLRATILQNTGLPTCVGVGRTKVLAKLANSLAKKSHGVHIIKPEDEINTLIATYVGDLWGIGSKLNKRLTDIGIFNAHQLAQADSKMIRDQFSIVVSRIQDELNGKSRLPLEESIEPRKEIMVSRSFGQIVVDKEQLRNAIDKFIEEGSRKLRKQHSEANIISVTVNTNRFNAKDAQYHRAAQIKLPYATSSSKALRGAALSLIEAIYRPGYKYKRAGILLSNLTPAMQHQQTLFDQAPDTAIDIVKDRINRRFGRTALKPAALVGRHQQWEMKQQFLSKQYTTNWKHLPIVS